MARYLPAEDPHRAGFVAGFLPLLLTSLACGVALLFVVRSHPVHLVGLLIFASLAGLIAGGILHGLHLVGGSYPAAASTIALLALAVSATVSGLGAALGNPGIAVGALLVFFAGNPISGLASAPELLPKPWGTIGQLLPPGAGAIRPRPERSGLLPISSPYVSLFQAAARTGALKRRCAYVMQALPVTTRDGPNRRRSTRISSYT